MQSFKIIKLKRSQRIRFRFFFSKNLPTIDFIFRGISGFFFAVFPRFYLFLLRTDAIFIAFLSIQLPEG